MEQKKKSGNLKQGGAAPLPPDPLVPSVDSLQSDTTLGAQKKPDGKGGSTVYVSYTQQMPTALGPNQQQMAPVAGGPYPQVMYPGQPPYVDAAQWKQGQPYPHPQPNPNDQTYTAPGGWGGAGAEFGYSVPPSAPQHPQLQYNEFSYSQPAMQMPHASVPVGSKSVVAGPAGGMAASAPPPASTAVAMAGPPGRSASVLEKGDTRSQSSDKINYYARPHSLMSCVRDGLRNVAFVELIPLSSLATAAFLHHYRHRHSKDFIPYSPPKWLKYVKNSLYAYSTYRFLIANGFIKQPEGPKPDGKRALAGDGSRSLEMSGEDHSEYGGSRALNLSDGKGNDDGYDGNDGHRAAAAPAEPGVFIFDPRYTIPKTDAKSYYRHVYADGADLRQTPSYVLGGAAGIRALRTEAHVREMIAAEAEMPADLDPEHMAMGLAIAEAEECIARKQQQVPRLADDDTIEYIGRIALATMGAIRERKRGAAPHHHLEHQENYSSSSNSSSTQGKHQDYIAHDEQLFQKQYAQQQYAQQQYAQQQYAEQQYAQQQYAQHQYAQHQYSLPQQSVPSGDVHHGYRRQDSTAFY
ncbi:hypothetical protein H4217_002785 [Coemansia sp. RSA 1939]|nr:hypothetical protein H4217_002785 [Coemansia sp. RSA 1939]KAJ2592696.1 hypothetical protein EV177_008683 [Coemansia sp. RSA 1804]